MALSRRGRKTAPAAEAEPVAQEAADEEAVVAEEPKEEKKAETAPPVTESSEAKKSKEEVGTYELIDIYPIIGPKSKGGIRFVPGEPKMHPVCSWTEHQVKAKVLRRIK